MNHTQIRYFLTAARCLNFTEAAKELFITQPALSQQITAIETELNMQLFIRQKNKLRLTPAALVLMEKLPGYQREYDKIIDEARVANSGSGGLLKLGFLQGQRMTDHFREVYSRFRNAYPHIHIQLSVDSFSGLRKKLDMGELDLIYTVGFDIEGCTHYLMENVDIDQGTAVVSTLHHLYYEDVEKINWIDLKNETIILVKGIESETVTEMVIEDCRRAGYVPNLLLAPSLEEQMLWIDAGLGVGIINQDSYICMNPDVRELTGLDFGTHFFSIAWHRDNMNPPVALFSNYLTQYMNQHPL